MARPRLLAAVSGVAALLVSGAVLATPAVATPAAAAAPHPRTPSRLSSAIEPLANYVGQVSCQPTARAGTVKLARLLASTYKSYRGSSWNSTYACGTDGTQSEHYDGRAIDWMVSVRNAGQRAAAQAAIKWLLATDRAGNKFAMARRLGVMYLIYNNRMWGAWSGRWEQYNGCAKLRSRADDNACHRTHVHISLSWNGALGHTSFWGQSVRPTDYGPCRPADLNWAYLYQRANHAGCRNYARVHAKKGSSATKKALVTYSGAPVRHNWHGPAVSAVQRALHLSPTGTYNAKTVAAVRAFQSRRRGGPVTGAMNPATWRALLAAVR